MKIKMSYISCLILFSPNSSYCIAPKVMSLLVLLNGPNRNSQDTNVYNIMVNCDMYISFVCLSFIRKV